MPGKRLSIITIAIVFFTCMYFGFIPSVYAGTQYKMADYWPLEVGSKWEYNDGSLEVVSSEEINGINTFKIKDTGSCAEGEEMPFLMMRMDLALCCQMAMEPIKP